MTTFEKKHAPKKLDDGVFTDASIPERLKDYANGGRKGNLILHGPYGSGKSTAAKAVASQDGQLTDLEVNVHHAADITEKTFDRMLGEWAFGRLNVTHPVTVIDEVDQLDSKLQRKLRAHMDRYGDLGSFVMTTNNIESIDGGIRDRSDEIEMPHPGSDAWMKRAQKILKREGCSMHSNDLKDLIETTDGSHRQIMRGLETVSKSVQRSAPPPAPSKPKTRRE